MKIGIDLDGVLFDTESYFHALAELKDLDSGKNGIIDRSKQLLRERYDWTTKEMVDFFDEILEDVELNAPIMPLGKEILNRLKNDGHEIIFITNRTKGSEKEIDYTYQRFEKENIKCDKIIFTKNSKLSYCKSEKIDIMIDDRAGVVNELAENNIPCIYFKDFAPVSVCKPNIYEACNWPEVYRIIKNMKNNDRN